jgi:hypothetical protein
MPAPRLAIAHPGLRVTRPVPIARLNSSVVLSFSRVSNVAATSGDLANVAALPVLFWVFESPELRLDFSRGSYPMRLL